MPLAAETLSWLDISQEELFKKKERVVVKKKAKKSGGHPGCREYGEVMRESALTNEGGLAELTRVGESQEK